MNNSSNHLGDKGTSFGSCNLSRETGDELIKNDLKQSTTAVEDSDFNNTNNDWANSDWHLV